MDIAGDVQIDPPGSYERPSFVWHTGIVLKKNLLIKTRAWKGLALEVILPVVFMCALIPPYAVAGYNESPDVTYAGQFTEDVEEFIQTRLLCNKSDTCVDGCIGDLCLNTGAPSFPADLIVLLSGQFKVSKAPRFDSVVMLRNLGLISDLPGSSDFGQNLPNALSTGMNVAVVPGEGTGAEVVGLVEDLKQYLYNGTETYRHVSRDFESEEAALEYAKSREGSETMWGIIVIQSETEYVIRTNRSSTPITQSNNDISEQRGEDNSYQMYLIGGWLTLQDEVNSWIGSRLLPGDAPLRLKPARNIPMPFVSYKQNSFLSQAGGFLSLILAFAFLYPVAQTVSSIVREKESRIREGMLIMGLSSTAFKISWFLTGFIQMTITAALVTFVLCLSFLNETSPTLIWMVMWLYCTSIVAFSLLLSVFFSSGQLAVIVSPLVFLATVIPKFALGDDISTSRMNSISLLSSAAFSEAIELFSDAQSRGAGLRISDAGKGSYSINTAIFWLLFDTLLYVFLAWYFDQVIPSEWGAKKPWYFIFWPPLWRHSGAEHIDENAVDGAMDPDMIEEVTDPQVMDKGKVQLTNLRKEFHSDGVDKVAVNNMNLCLYEDQIQVLLGHNGAGKTTMINMLTGMLPVTSGTASVYGNSIASDLGLVRQDIGLCPQHNILWDNLTCSEHLRFFGRLKGIAEDVLEEKVDFMLRNVDLYDKKETFSSGLSGGMKRKLSVAIALIGAPRFVLFDEPTAGMDVQARRAVWDLLRSCRKGRTVLLTTHFMDEADLLGDNIAIMHGGRLHCKGSSLFLKSRLGVGYNLKLDFDNGKDHGPVTALITETVKPLKKENSQEVELLSSAGTELSYRVPMWSVPLFPELFDKLEGEGKEMGVRGFGVGVTTLEEIFIKIAGTDHDAPPPPRGSTELQRVPEAEITTALLAGEAHGKYTTLDIAEPISFEEAVEIKVEDRLKGGAFYNSQWRGLFYKRYKYTTRDRCTLCIQLLLPVLLIIFALSLSNLPVDNLPAINLNEFDDVTLWGVNEVFQNVSLEGYTTDTVAQASTIEAMDEGLLTTYNGHGDTDRWIGTFRAANSDDDVVWNYFNMTRTHSIAYSSTASVNAQLRNLGIDKVIKATNHPLPFSEYFRTQIEGFQAVVIGIFILIPFTFIPSNFVAFLVRERECKSKHVQLVSGVRLSAYWAASFVWDFCCFMFTTFLTFIIFILFDRSEYIGSVEAVTAFFLLFIFYGLTSISAAYLASFYFSSHTKAQNLVMLGNFLSGYVLVVVVTVLQFIESTEGVAKVLRFIFRLVPAFCLGDGIVQLSTVPTTNSLGFNTASPLDMGIVGWDLVFLGLMFPIYTVSALVHDFPELLYKLGLRKLPPKEEGEEEEGGGHEEDLEEDEDVARERREVEVEGGRVGDVVSVQRLRKVYPPSGNNPKPKVAVKNVSFGVKSNEIFAFLGTNGAGKTTTLSVLSGDFPPTSGRGFISGHDVVTETSIARRELGYCPQFDALLDLLTPREHLELYASLRGVPYERRKAMIDALINVFDLQPHQNKRCKSLSGGNKRKTSIAISLIGGPSCVLLDEPTAGMDPVARRGLWTALQKIGEGRCVILTTHHLEEVEAVSHRMAVMVDGSLQCMGTLTHLKNKFGGAFEVEVKTTREKEDEVLAFFKECFSDAELIESTNARMTYKVPTASRKLSEMFRLIGDNKERLSISDYSISHTSLEQVFMAICRRHLERHAHTDESHSVTSEVPLAGLAQTNESHPVTQAHTGKHTQNL